MPRFSVVQEIARISRPEWIIIWVATLLPCGIHYAMGINSLREYFQSDPLWDPPIDGARWGLFQAILTFPNLLLPIIGGLFMDVLHKTIYGTRIFLVVTVVGQWVFAYGVYLRSFPVSITGRLLFGLGSGGVSSAAAAILAKGMQKRSRLNIVAIGVGITESFHAFSTMMSSALPVYIALATGCYWAPIAIGALFCTLCMVLGFVTLTDCETSNIELIGLRSVGSRFGGSCVLMRDTTKRIPFILTPLLAIHFCTSGAHRLFGHVDSAFFYNKYHVNVKEAGLMSSAESLLGVFLPPLLGGVFISRENVTKLPAIILSVTCLFGSIGYFMLAQGDRPAIPLTLLSLCNACTPTLLKALVAVMVHSSCLATAYGMFEASESLVKTIGGVAVGIFRDKLGGYDQDVAMFGVLLVCASAASLLLAVRGKPARVYNRDMPLLRGVTEDESSIL
eukprot:GEMP01024237.1.p1 GENE.GEMP01024237.1~~GEMP01024237.1.p1  ORF type:complete len:449 (+),score=74.08 GEMP01024237.1:62-1408(+)